MKKMMRKIAMGILAVIGLICIDLKGVYADTYTLSRNDHIAKYKNGQYVGEFQFFVVNSEKIGYCIEEGSDVSYSNPSSSTYYYSSDQSDIRECVGLATWYGAESYSDWNEKKKYIASQVYIWNVCYNKSDTYVFKDSSYNDIDYSSQYSALVNNINNYKTKPSFCGGSFTATSSTLSLTDSKSVLSRYKNLSSSNSTSVSANNNTLQLNNIQTGTTTITVTNPEDNNYVLIDFGTYQDIYKGLYLPEVSCTFTVNYDPVVNVEKGSIKIVKVQTGKEDVKLAGVTFDVKNSSGTVVKTVTTDSNGEAVINNLDLGTYTIVEKSLGTNTNYVLDSTPRTVVLTDTSVKTVTFSNLKKGTIKVIKIEKDNSVVKLKGVEFELYNEDNELIVTKTTDENGEVYFDDITYGKYYIKETKTNEGYVMDNKVHTIVLDEDMIEEIFENELINVKTGRILLYVVYAVGLGALGYAVYYIIKSKKSVK